jgi:GntR family transcriptional regulator
MALGHKPSSTILEFDTIRPDEKLQRMLSLQSGDIPVFRFVRIRRLDGLPLLLETSYYPRYVYPNLTREILETHSMYSLLYEVGIVPASAEDSYRAVILGEREAELLGCAPGSPGFYHERRTKSDLGEIFEFTQSLIRGDRTRLDVLMQKNGVAFSRHFEKG